MKIANDAKATVFELREDEKVRRNTVMANISTYEGKDKEGNAVYSSWRANFVGDAYEKAKELKDKDRIILNNAKVENSYNKETEKLYITVTIFDFVVAN